MAGMATSLEGLGLVYGRPDRAGDEEEEEEDSPVVS